MLGKHSAPYATRPPKASPNAHSMSSLLFPWPGPKLRSLMGMVLVRLAASSPPRIKVSLSDLGRAHLTGCVVRRDRRN